MVRSAEAISRKKERAERRQSQILDAARACVRTEGLHAASMSRIATEAGMSVGHIYQYFENKEAIMLALCERELADFILHVREIGDRAGPDVETIIQTFAAEIIWLVDYDRSALTLEVMAEAGRNAKFAELVLNVDVQIRRAIRAIIAPVLNDVNQEQSDVRIETLLVMTRGLAIQIGTRSLNDRQQLTPGFERAFRGVLSPY